MLHHLLQRDLSSFDVRQVPKSKALGEQKHQSLGPIDKWWFEKHVAGEFESRLRSVTPWGQVPTAAVFEDYLESLGKTGVHFKATETALGMRLRKLLPPGDYRQRVAAQPPPWNHSIATQQYVYNLPPLVDCRAHFETIMQLVGKIDWTAAEILD